MTSEKAHCYELRWTVKNARSRLLARETLVSGSQEVSDPEEQNLYKFTVSMTLKPETKRDDHLELIADIADFRKSSAVHVLLSSHVEKVALHAFKGSDGVYEVEGVETFRCKTFRRDDLLDESAGLIVNDTLTIVLAFLINVSGDWIVSLASKKDPPPETSALATAFDDEFCDVVLRSSDGRQFRAHKVILAVHSPVFRAMLGSGLKESKESQVEIADCSAAVVEQMLSFIYTEDEPEVGDDILFDLLKAADKYDMKDLVAVCENKIAQSTNSDNVAEVLVLADTFGAKMLRKSAMDWAVRHIRDVMKSPGWKTLSETQPRILDEILQTVVENHVEL